MSKKKYIVENPQLMEEWSWEKNKDFNPATLACGSEKKVWWKCSKGHEWEAQINNRKNGNGCPYCSGRYPIIGVNDLATTQPQLLKEWNYEKNNNLLPNMLKEQSNKKVWWKCSVCGHEWEAVISNRTKGSSCPNCGVKKMALQRMKVKNSLDSLASLYPKLTEEWNYEKNKDITPHEIKPKTNKKVWWRCKEGHEWQSSPNTRIYGSNCPYCSNQKVLEGYNDLATSHPKLAEEWHPTKNGDLTPTKVTKGSSKRVWWKCSKGHEWETAISSRSNGTNCPYCSNQMILKGFNDLLTLNPKLAEEWHPTKNGDLTPEKVGSCSGKKVWWRCKEGHEWKALISSRNQNHQCPECLKGLKTSLPEQAIFYYIKKEFNDAINSYKPEWLNGKEIDIFIPSLKLGIEYDGIAWHKKIDRDIEKNILIKQNKINLIRIREKGMPYLTDDFYCIETDKYDFNLLFLQKPLLILFDYIQEKYKLNFDYNVDIKRDYDEIFNAVLIHNKNNNIEKTHPYLISEWDFVNNKNLLPNMFVSGSEKIVWWICCNNHHYQTSIYNRTRGRGCPYCSGKKVLEGYNDLATTHPSLVKEWHPTKNGDLTPTKVSKGSSKKVWWKCSKGHEWETTVNSRMRTNCPYCSGRKVLEGYNDLATTHPSLVKEWHLTKNGDLTPTKVSKGSGKKVWWKCSVCGHEWETLIVNRTKGSNCPKCYKENL